MQEAQLRHVLNQQPPAGLFYRNLEYSPDLPPKALPNGGGGACLPIGPRSLANHAGTAERVGEDGTVVRMTTMSGAVREKYVTLVYYEYKKK